MEGSPVIQLAEAPAVKSMEQIAAEIRIFFMKPTPFTMSYLYYSGKRRKKNVKISSRCKNKAGKAALGDKRVGNRK